MKHCKRCDTLKSLNEFHPSKRHKEGLHQWCKPCLVSANKIYSKNSREMSKIKNIDENAEYPATFSKTCPRCGETKSMDKFSKSSTSSNGYQSYCKVCSLNFDKDKKELLKTKRKISTQSNYNNNIYFEELRGGKGIGRPSNDLFDLTPERIEFLNQQREEWRKIFAERHDDIMKLIEAYEAEPDNSVALIQAFHENVRINWKLKHKTLNQQKQDYYDYLRQIGNRIIG